MTDARRAPSGHTGGAEAPGQGAAAGSTPVLVSIIVNNYNYERFLGHAIDSALAQTYPHVEVLVVDDGSTDGSREVIARYGGRVKAVLKENGGQASAFNAGFEACRGDVVMYLDADDMLLPETAARVVAAWRPGTAKAQFRLRVVDGEGKPTGGAWPPPGHPMPNGDLAKDVLARAETLIVPTSGNAFSREALRAILPVPADEWRITADVYLTYLAPLHGGVVSLEDELGEYRVHGNNNWSHSAPDAARVAAHVKIDLQKEAAIVAEARRLRLPVAPELILNSPWHVNARIMLSLMDPRNPLETLSLPRLASRGVRATWADPHTGLAMKVASTLWLSVLPVAPRPVARRLAEWRFYPEQRPALLRRGARRAG